MKRWDAKPMTKKEKVNAAVDALASGARPATSVEAWMLRAMQAILKKTEDRRARLRAALAAGKDVHAKTMAARQAGVLEKFHTFLTKAGGVGGKLVDGRVVPRAPDGKFHVKRLEFLYGFGLSVDAWVKTHPEWTLAPMTPGELAALTDAEWPRLSAECPPMAVGDLMLAPPVAA